MKLIIDAHSWIEYLEGSKTGEKLNNLFKEENEIFVLPITISEVVSYTARSKGNIDVAYNSIIKNAKIIQPTPKIAKETGVLHAQMRKKDQTLGIVDCLLISMAKATNSNLVTGDNHFKQFKESIIL